MGKVIYQGVEFESLEDVKKAVDMGIVQKHDVVGTSPNAQVPHGLWYDQNIGGLFTRPGAEPGMYSTTVMPSNLAFLSRLFRGVTNIVNPEYDVLSGFKDLTGTAADSFCHPGMKAGNAKLCTLRSAFGEFKIETDQESVIKAGGRVNRADLDRNLVNMLPMIPLLPDVIGRARNLNSPLGLAMVKTAVAIIREWTRVLFTGNYGTKSRAFISEFNGFDQLLIENPTDVTGATCAAASSVVFNWNNTDVAGSVNGDDLVTVLSGIMHLLEGLSGDTELPATWDILVDRDLFWLITAMWPCSYLTNGCAVTTDGGERLNVGAAEQIAMRDEMRRGSFLWINGKRQSVATFTSIARTAVGAGFSSPLYIVPMTAMGEQVTFLEAFDENNPGIREMLTEFAGLGMEIKPMSGGLWAHTYRRSDYCIEHMFAAQPRLICRTPWLGARIEAINYHMPAYLYSRDSNPSGIYHKNGGRYYNDLPAYAEGSI